MEASEFWNTVKASLKKMGKSQEWLCSMIGQPVPTLRNQICQERLPSMDEAGRIMEILGLDANAVYGITAKYNDDDMRIPVLDQVFSAGHGQLVPDSDEPDDYVLVPHELKVDRSHLSAVKVRGDSMEPTLHDDDRIICDDLGYDGSDGIYVIQYKGMGFVKRLQRSLDGIKIISDNRRYDPMTVNKEDQDFRVIGRVRYVFHRL